MIDFVYFDDWCAVYQDGKKIHEDHSPDAEILLTRLGIPSQSRYLSSNDYDQDSEIPDNLNELPAGQP